MTQLRELDLQLAFEATGTLREDVQNQTGAIKHSTLEECFEISFLTWRERMIENDEIGLLLDDERANLFSFARSDEKP
jgi:hypothetical protein